MILERRVRLDIRERDGPGQPAPGLQVYDHELRVFPLRIGVRGGHDLGDADRRLFVTRVVDEHRVARLHGAQVLQGDGVLHAVPHRASVALQPVVAVGGGFGLEEPVAGHGVSPVPRGTLKDSLRSRPGVSWSYRTAIRAQFATESASSATTSSPLRPERFSTLNE